MALLCINIYGKEPWNISFAIFFSKVSCEHGRLRRPGGFFAVSAPFALPKARQKAQKLQKIFSVAVGDHAHIRK
jgi:hypothetical protein